MARAAALSGRPLGEVAARLGLPVPPDQRRAKGWIGQLVERALGAEASSRAEPDFPALGIELKTIPVDRLGRPRETTFVCTIAPLEIGAVAWQASLLRRKLDHVLWVPVEADRAVPLADRRLGGPLLWRPGPEEEAGLREDWEELAGLIGRGLIDDLTGHLGRWLQVRPKAAHGGSRRLAPDSDGSAAWSLPRGFYLRTSFTRRILVRGLVVPR